MTLKLREMISDGGPDTLGCWAPLGFTQLHIQVMTNSQPWPLYVAPQPSTYSTVHGTAVDYLSNAGYIQTLSGLWFMADANVSANLTTDIYFSVYRAGSQVGSARIAGWSSGATPALTALVPTFVPFYTTNTTALSSPPGVTLSTTKALCRLKPLDVITVELSTVNQFTANLFVGLDIQ